MGILNLHTSAAMLACSLLVAGAPAKATVIGFDSIDASAGPVAVTSQFAGLGVSFSNLFVMESSAPFVSTAPNVGVINDEVPFSLLVTATFSAAVSDVSAVFFDSNVGTNLVTMKAFDAANALLGTTIATTPGSQMQVVSLSFAGTRRVTLETDADGSLFDDFTFTPAVAVPEPGMVALFGFGLAAMGLGRRRKRA